MIYHDVLVIGSGISGQKAALEASKNGSSVGIITKLRPMNSHSVLAQGGINIALDEIDKITYLKILLRVQIIWLIRILLKF